MSERLQITDETLADRDVKSALRNLAEVVACRLQTDAGEDDHTPGDEDALRYMQELDAALVEALVAALDGFEHDTRRAYMQSLGLLKDRVRSVAA